jgi:uncharacterized protein
MDNFKTAGAVSWHELSTTDVESAKAYYSGLFGWTMEAMDMSGMPYTVIKVGDMPIGGISASRDGQTGWQDYVTVADIDATVAKASTLGAKVLVDVTAIPTVGRFAVLADPQGGVIAAIQYLDS